MSLLLLVLLLALVLGGLGFMLHVLWIAALVLLVVWLFAMAAGRERWSHR